METKTQPLSTLLYPATRAMRRLRLLPKFLLVSLLFILPLGMVTGMLMSELNKSISHSQLERQGVAELLRLQNLARLVQQRRGMEHLRLSGQSALDNTALSARAAAAVDLAPPLNEAWQALLNGPKDARAVYARHQAMLQAIAKRAKLVADTSHLSTDPEIATDTLIASFSKTLPELAEGLSDIAARGGAYIDSGLFAAHEDELVNASAMIARHTLDGLPATPATKAGLAFLERTHNEVSNSVGQTSGLAFFSAGMQALDALYAQAADAARALDLALDARIEQDLSHRNLILAAIGTTLLLAAYLIAGFYASFTRDIRRLQYAVRRAARGDLSLRPRSTASDEIGELVNAFGGMTGGLVNMVGEIRRGAAAIGQSTLAIAGDNAVLASHTGSQTQALRDTVGSMRELAATVQQNAQHANQGRQLAVQASGVAQRGGQAVQDVVATMSAIRASAHRIADIVGLINSIAFQTNILALNAAVEAARAGEHGRGFAVVASEVRSLAQRSAEAAKEIKQLVDESVRTVDQGKSMVDHAGGTISDLVQAVEQVAVLIGDMAEGSKLQAQEIVRIEDALARIDDMTRQNASLVAQAEGASSHLNSESYKLTHAVAVFTLEAPSRNRLTKEHANSLHLLDC